MKLARKITKKVSIIEDKFPETLIIFAKSKISLWKGRNM